jgi:hypothetical protein
MGVGRFIHQTSGFSEKLKNGLLMLLFFFVQYKGVRMLQSLRMAPAMVSCIADMLHNKA